MFLTKNSKGEGTVIEKVVVFGELGDFYDRVKDFVQKSFELAGYTNKEDIKGVSDLSWVPVSELKQNKGKVLVASFPNYNDDVSFLVNNLEVEKNRILVLYDEWNKFLIKSTDTYYVLAQYGEDFVVSQFLKQYGIKEKDAIYLEIGVDDPIYINNTYHMHMNGAKGYLVEANPDSIALIEVCRKSASVYNVACVPNDDAREVEFSIAAIPGHSSINFDWAATGGGVRKTIKIKAVTVNQILSQIKEHVNFISIDVEGLDWELLKSIDLEKYKPEVICSEINFPGEREICVMKEKGYRLGYNNHCNSIWYRE